MFEVKEEAIVSDDSCWRSHIEQREMAEQLRDEGLAKKFWDDFDARHRNNFGTDHLREV
jgi:hypothetical protein